MNSRLFLYGSFLLLGLGSSTAMAQIPIQKAKDPAATEVAGIASYYLTRDESLEDLPDVEYSCEVEALDVEGATLASCEIEWLENSKVMTCTMPGGERFEAKWYPDHVEFADLRTGEHFSLSKEGTVDLRAAKAESTNSPLDREGWVVRGTKTRESVEQDWGHITPIFGYLLAEVEITLGRIPGDRLFLDRRIRSSNHPSQSGLPLTVDLCDGGPSFCDSSDVCEVSQVFASSRSACCAGASSLADSCCMSFTLVDCCANTLCSSVCPLGIFCECFLDGWKKKSGVPCD